MILADKIIEERKKLGLSQEELAEKLSVSRQAVSKWESAQSIPDLQKIILMSELFSVTTDYLLKEEMEPENRVSTGAETDRTIRRVSMEEANDFLAATLDQSKNVSFGVLLCILCPVLLIFLAGLSETGIIGITENTAVACGLAALFILVAAAVFLFIRNGSRIERFEYLEKEEFETAYGVTGLVKEKKAEFDSFYSKYLALGIILCVLSPLPLILASVITGGNKEVIAVSMVSLLLCIVAFGVYMIVRVAIINSGYQILLQEGDYKVVEKKASSALGTANGLYWSLVTAVYLTWSFITMRWGNTWIIWPVAAVLCAPVMILVRLLSGKNEK